MSEEKLLLEDIRIIDAASFIAGPAAATIMSDYGAEVIKIEPVSYTHLTLPTKA